MSSGIEVAGWPIQKLDLRLADSGDAVDVISVSNPGDPRREYLELFSLPPDTEVLTVAKIPHGTLRAGAAFSVTQLREDLLTERRKLGAERCSSQSALILTTIFPSAERSVIILKASRKSSKSKTLPTTGLSAPASNQVIS